MCWAAVAAIATVVGTAMSTFGAIQSGNAQRQAADYNATVARQQADANRQFADQQATATTAEAERRAVGETQQASADELIARDRFRRMQATARASLGISGQTGEGSATDLLAENAAAGELDALTVRYGGAQRAAELRAGGANNAYSMRSQAALNASGLYNQAGLYNYQGGQAQTAGYLGAGTSLLAGAGSFARNFRFGNNGLEFSGYRA